MVSEIVEGRAVIDQAKGTLMLLYGIDAEAAFDKLSQQSQRHNVKRRLIAEQATWLSFFKSEAPSWARLPQQAHATAHHRSRPSAPGPQAVAHK